MEVRIRKEKQLERGRDNTSVAVQMCDGENSFKRVIAPRRHYRRQMLQRNTADGSEVYTFTLIQQKLSHRHVTGFGRCVLWSAISENPILLRSTTCGNTRTCFLLLSL